MSKTLGDRMKRYEAVTDTLLTNRTPVILRVDGAHFRNFTKSLKKPYDAVFIAAMQETCQYLVDNISGAKFGYVESDEISILLTDYDTFTTVPWFDNRVQKLCSSTAAIATAIFNRKFAELTSIYVMNNTDDPFIGDANSYMTAYNKLPYFDCRAFNVPKEDVANYFLWRQRDAIRNSIEGLARSLYSDKELFGKNTSNMEEMIAAKGKAWSEYPIPCKRGSCCYRVTKNNRSEVIIDKEMIQLNDKAGREFVDSFVFIGEE